MNAPTSRLAPTVSPIVGRKYSALGHHVVIADVVDDLTETPVSWHASYRGCCYTQLTKTLLVCDPVNCCVQTFDVQIRSDTEIRFTPRGQIGSRGSASGRFTHPVAVDVNSRGEVAVADFKLNRISFFTGSGSALHHFGKTGNGRSEFRGLVDIKFTVLGHVAAVDSENHRIQVVTATGGVVMVFGTHGWRNGEFNIPCAVDVARNGDFFVCDWGNKRIQRFTAKGKFLAVWGSRRLLHPTTPRTPQYDSNGFIVTLPPLKSIFETPCDLFVGLHGDVYVADAGLNEVHVFSNSGNCLQILSIPAGSNMKPIAMCMCRSTLVMILRSFPLDVSGPAKQDISLHVQLDETGSKHQLLLYPPPDEPKIGKFANWSWQSFLDMISYLTYSDAIHLRIVNREFHKACRILRNQWRLHPLSPGAPSVVKYGKVVTAATGQAAVLEVFEKWGLRIYKPSHSIRKHVMDFESGFRNALSALFGPMFFYRHEEILRQVFQHYAKHEKQEINQEMFVEIVTEIEEIRAGFLLWRQCPSLQGKVVPPVRTAQIDPLLGESPTNRPSLTFIENAQQQQVNRLLSKLLSL